MRYSGAALCKKCSFWQIRKEPPETYADGEETREARASVAGRRAVGRGTRGSGEEGLRRGRFQCGEDTAHERYAVGSGKRSMDGEVGYGHTS